MVADKGPLTRCQRCRDDDERDNDFRFDGLCQDEFGTTHMQLTANNALPARLRALTWPCKWAHTMSQEDVVNLLRELHNS